MDNTNISISSSGDSTYDDMPSLAPLGVEETKTTESQTDTSGSSTSSAAMPEASAEATEGPSAAFTFENLSKELKSITNRELASYWEKWNLDARRCVRTFQFNKKFDADGAASFLFDFFNSPEVTTHFHGFAKSGTPQALPRAVVAVDFEPVPATVTSMEFFDRLSEAGIVSGEGGYIKKRLDEIIEGVTVCDDLKDALINPDSEHADTLYSDSEKKEFLYKLFKMVVTGGPMCQYEDVAAPYLDFTKQLYKDLLTVGKDPKTEKISVQSHVFSVSALRVNTGSRVERVSPFPEENPHSVLWISIDPIRRLVTAFYHAWVPFW